MHTYTYTSICIYKYGAGKRLAEEPQDENAPMTFDEKRDLCGSMNKLPGKALARAVSLIHERVPKVCYIPEIIPGLCTHYPQYIAAGM